MGNRQTRIFVPSESPYTEDHWYHTLMHVSIHTGQACSDYPAPDMSLMLLGFTSHAKPPIGRFLI